VIAPINLCESAFANPFIENPANILPRGSDHRGKVGLGQSDVDPGAAIAPLNPQIAFQTTQQNRKLTLKRQELTRGKSDIGLPQSARENAQHKAIKLRCLVCDTEELGMRPGHHGCFFDR